MGRYRGEDLAPGDGLRNARPAPPRVAAAVRQGLLPAADRRGRDAARGRRRPGNRARCAAPDQPLLPRTVGAHPAALRRVRRTAAAPGDHPLLHRLRRGDGPPDRRVRASRPRRARPGRSRTASPPQPGARGPVAHVVRDPPGGHEAPRRAPQGAPVRRDGLDNEAASIRPRPPVARGDRARGPGAATDDPDPGVSGAAPRSPAGDSRTRPSVTRWRVLIAPDSFKGSLSSVEVARALADGWRRGRPGDEVIIAPLADGGEGTLTAIEAGGGWEWQEVPATDPIGRPIRARWLRSTDGDHAVIELAEASGLSLVPRERRDPIRASTLGTGQVLRAVLDGGIRHIVLGIGGSATTDGGAGILEALGARFGPDGIDLAGLDTRLSETELRIACDVTNPLLGPRGAAATYGPQKGATPDDVRELDHRLTLLADALEAATGRRERETSGAGAAGGTAFGLLCVRERFRSLALVPGVQLVMDETGLLDKLETANLVITGEGSIDAQTAFGKTALGVARAARACGVPCIAVGGGIDVEGIAALAECDAIVVPVAERPMTVEEAMAAGAVPLQRCGERLARVTTLGARVTTPGSRGRASNSRRP